MDYFGNFQFAIAFDNTTPLASPPANTIQIQDSIETLMRNFSEVGLHKVELKVTFAIIKEGSITGFLLHSSEGMFLRFDKRLFPVDPPRGLETQLKQIFTEAKRSLLQSYRIALGDNQTLSEAQKAQRIGEVAGDIARLSSVSMSTEITTEIGTLVQIKHSFNELSRNEWGRLLSKFQLTPEKLTPKEKTTLYIAVKTMAYYFPSIPTNRDSLTKFLTFFSTGNPEVFTQQEQLHMATDERGTKEWNSKLIQNIYGRSTLSDEFFQRSFTDFASFNLMPSDDPRLSNSEIDKAPFQDKCFMFKSEGGAHDYGIMFKRDNSGIFAVVLDSTTSNPIQSYRNTVNDLARKLEISSEVAIVKPLTTSGNNWLFPEGGVGVQNMCRFTPAVYSGTEFTRSSDIAMNELAYTNAFSWAFDALQLR